LELVRTWTPLMVVESSVVPLPLEAGAEEAAGAELLPPAAAAGLLEDVVVLLELAHADAARARAAIAAAPSIFRIGILPFTVLFISQLKLRTSHQLGSAGVGRRQAGVPAEYQPGRAGQEDHRGRLNHEDDVGLGGGEREAEAEDADGAG